MIEVRQARHFLAVAQTLHVGRAFAAECRKLLIAAQHVQHVATQAQAG